MEALRSNQADNSNKEDHQANRVAMEDLVDPRAVEDSKLQLVEGSNPEEVEDNKMVEVENSNLQEELLNLLVY